MRSPTTSKLSQGFASRRGSGTWCSLCLWAILLGSGCGSLSELQIGLTRCLQDSDCADTQQCVLGYCVEAADASELEQSVDLCGEMSCPEGTVCCGSLCVELSTSCVVDARGVESCEAPNNCGLCGVACDDAESCVDGRCQCGSSVCLATEGCCGTSCADLSSDTANCGICGRGCQENMSCVAGRCECYVFGQGLTCTGQQSCCPDLGCFRVEDDPRACGQCQDACRPGERCVEGQCTCGEPDNSTVCEAGQRCCAGACRDDDDPSCLCGTALCGVGEGCCLDPASGLSSCVDLSSSDQHCGECETVCEAGTRCEDRNCEAYCPPGLARCASSCIDINSDPLHCGACDNACAENQVCAAGACSTRCPVGFENCTGACVQLSTAPEHCGACATPCSASKVCSQGKCESYCSPGELECGGACVDQLSNRFHCGDCFVSCLAGLVCQDGGCRESCSESWTNCGGSCVQLDRDRSHCGACGARCGLGEICQGGVCRVSCPSGQINCDGSCVDAQSDASFCGATAPCTGDNRGVPCAEGEVCVMGRCEANCGGGLANCGGACVDAQNNPLHCGACNKNCTTLPNASNSYCAGGVCRLRCTAGFGNCNGEVNDGCEASMTSMSNCGSCGNTCPAVTGVSCTSGKCVLSCSGSSKDCNANMADGCESTTSSSLINCGACGNTCPTYPNSTRSCVSGSCGSSCLPDYANCDSSYATGCESHLLTSSQHCGGCQQPCQNAHGSSACEGGTCFVSSCDEGWLDCDGDARNGCEAALTSTQDCGGCGVLCGFGAGCVGSACVCPGGTETCAAGHHCVGSSCYCGIAAACVPSAMCIDGQCVI